MAHYCIYTHITQAHTHTHTHMYSEWSVLFSGFIWLNLSRILLEYCVYSVNGNGYRIRWCGSFAHNAIFKCFLNEIQWRAHTFTHHTHTNGVQCASQWVSELTTYNVAAYVSWLRSDETRDTFQWWEKMPEICVCVCIQWHSLRKRNPITMPGIVGIEFGVEVRRAMGIAWKL